MGYEAGRCNKTSTPEGVFVVIPSIEGWPTKAKEATSPHEVRLTPLDTNRLFQCLEKKTLTQKQNGITEKLHLQFFGKSSWYQNTALILKSTWLRTRTSARASSDLDAWSITHLLLLRALQIFLHFVWYDSKAFFYSLQPWVIYRTKSIQILCNVSKYSLTLNWWERRVSESFSRAENQKLREEKSVCVFHITQS